MPPKEITPQLIEQIIEERRKKRTARQEQEQADTICCQVYLDCKTLLDRGVYIPPDSDEKFFNNFFNVIAKLRKQPKLPMPGGRHWDRTFIFPGMDEHGEPVKITISLLPPLFGNPSNTITVELEELDELFILREKHGSIRKNSSGFPTRITLQEAQCLQELINFTLKDSNSK